MKEESGREDGGGEMCKSPFTRNTNTCLDCSCEAQSTRAKGTTAGQARAMSSRRASPAAAGRRRNEQQKALADATEATASMDSRAHAQRKTVVTKLGDERERRGANGPVIGSSRTFVASSSCAGDMRSSWSRISTPMGSHSAMAMAKNMGCSLAGS